MESGQYCRLNGPRRLNVGLMDGLGGVGCAMSDTHADSMPPMPVAEPRFFNLRVLRNASIAIVMSALGGFAVGLLQGVLPVMTLGAILILSNGLSVVLCGFVSALTPNGQPLLKHLTAVGLLVWACGLLSVFLGLARLIHGVL